jgi:hypothetical protein
MKKVSNIFGLPKVEVERGWIGLNTHKISQLPSYMKKSYKLKPKLRLWLKENITANKGWATQQK